jgi:hypothetical protein
MEWPPSEGRSTSTTNTNNNKPAKIRKATDVRIRSVARKALRIAVQRAHAAAGREFECGRCSYSQRRRKVDVVAAAAIRRNHDSRGIVA